jgi:hypothetical protein
VEQQNLGVPPQQGEELQTSKEEIHSIDDGVRTHPTRD